MVPRIHHLRHCDPARLDLYFHVICRDLDSKAFHSLPSRWFKNCAGFQVEAGAVPGADHFIVFDLTFPQRSAAMRTNILNCVQPSTRIETCSAHPTCRWVGAHRQRSEALTSTACRSETQPATQVLMELERAFCLSATQSGVIKKSLQPVTPWFVFRGPVVEPRHPFRG